MRFLYAVVGLASAADFTVPVSCSGSQDYFLTLPGATGAAPDPSVPVTAGETVTFSLTGCDNPLSHPFVIRLPLSQGGGDWTTGVTGSGQNSGNVVLVTDASTPALLKYRCFNHDLMTGDIVITGGAVPATAPSVTVDNPTTTSLKVSWTEGQTNGCTFASWKVQQGGVAVAGCDGSTNRSQTSCDVTGLTSNTNYGFTVAEVCSNAWANSPAGSQQASTLPIPANAPSLVSSSNVGSNSLTLSWVAGAANQCTFDSWKVVFSGTATPVPGCQGLSQATVTCTATGLMAGTNYSFDVSEVCSQASANSPIASSSSVKTLFPGPTSVSVSNVMPTSLTLTWEAPAPQCLGFGSWEVKSMGASVTGCTGITDRATLTCDATGLTSGASYTFQVREVCSDPVGVSSGWTMATTATPLAVEVNCTAGNNARYLVNGAANAALSVSAGTPLWFTVSGCDTQGFVVRYKGAAPSGSWSSQLTYSSGDATAGLSADGTVKLASSASTPGFLTYGSPNNTDMMGYITIVGGTVIKAGRPTSLGQVAGTLSSSGVGLSWTPGAANDCVFAAWIVKAGGNTYCNLTSLANNTCTADGLAIKTDYSFTVQQTCLNPAANSDVSTSVSITTSGNYGFPVVCQNGGTCNCGNASVCTCQNTDVCNCEHSETCVCQLGKCNGGYAKLFTCQSTDCNRQCADTCIGLCNPLPGGIPGLGRRLLDDACTISGQSVLTAPIALLFALALLWK